MTYDYDSFLKGLWTGLSLGRVPGGREPKHGHDPMFILTESGVYTLVEQMGEGVPIGTASSTVGCNWPLPLDLYQSAYQEYVTSQYNIWRRVEAYEGSVMLVQLSTENYFSFAVASDHPGEVGRILSSGTPPVSYLNTNYSYTLDGKTVYYNVTNIAHSYDNTYFVPNVPDRMPEFDGRECWIAVYGDIIYGNRMITEGS